MLAVADNQAAARLPGGNAHVLRACSHRRDGPRENGLDGVRRLNACRSFVFDLPLPCILLFVGPCSPKNSSRFASMRAAVSSRPRAMARTRCCSSAATLRTLRALVMITNDDAAVFRLRPAASMSRHSEPPKNF